MSDQILKDRAGRLIGKIKIRNDGKMEIRDRNGRLKGTYNPKTDQTRDKNGKLVGKGNLLTTLL